MSIAENIHRIRERIGAAAQRSGRIAGQIALMGVTKTFPPEHIREAYDAGLRLFGENRVQEFGEKVNVLRDLAGAEWHMVGHLQSNKANRAAELFVAVDSVDSLRVAERLNSAAEKLGKTMAILIEVNVGAEQAKSGVNPDSNDFDELLTSAPLLRRLEIRGLMTVPPFTDDPEGARPYFQHLRELRDQIAARGLPSVSMDVLSMGMSHDFEVAIEEGSTCVRVGTGIFGKR
jgi:pyridoxal phosphate enzyme (YggS family)